MAVIEAAGTVLVARAGVLGPGVAVAGRGVAVGSCESRVVTLAMAAGERVAGRAVTTRDTVAGLVAVA